MSNRKPATASKRAHTAKKVTHKAQRAAQAVVRSPIARAPAADSTKSPPEPQSKTDQEAHLIDSPAMVIEDESEQRMRATESKREPVFSSAMASAGAYQAKLLEMTQANMKFAWEFVQRLASIRSPFEFPSVIAEFTTKRVDMLRKHSKEIAEFTIKR